MKLLLSILLICFWLNCFSQAKEETFVIKKKKEEAVKLAMPIERTWANVSFKAANDSAKLIWWKTQLTGDDTIPLKVLRLGYSISLKYGDYGTQIVSFVMSFISNEKTIKLSSNRSYVTQAMAMELSNTRPGTTIVIEKMVYRRWQRTYDKSGSFIIETTDPNTPVETINTGPFRIFVAE